MLAGAARILLLGIDMRGKHWHPEHPEPSRDSEYVLYRRAFDKLAPLVKKAGVEVINCSPISALTCFPKGDIESLLPHP